MPDKSLTSGYPTIQKKEENTNHVRGAFDKKNMPDLLSLDQYLKARSAVDDTEDPQEQPKVHVAQSNNRFYHHIGAQPQEEEPEPARPFLPDAFQDLIQVSNGGREIPRRERGDLVQEEAQFKRRAELAMNFALVDDGDCREMDQHAIENRVDFGDNDLASDCLERFTPMSDRELHQRELRERYEKTKNSVLGRESYTNFGI